MDPILFCFSSSSDEECSLTDIRKQIRMKRDPLTLADSEFVKLFRLSKEAFRYVLEEIKFNGSFSTSIPPIIQLAAALSLLASGGFQHNVGNDFIIGVSQSAISRILQKFIVEVETKLCPKFIKFCPEESDGCREYFWRKYKIPGVIGCVDGTHIGLQKPKE